MVAGNPFCCILTDENHPLPLPVFTWFLMKGKICEGLAEENTYINRINKARTVRLTASVGEKKTCIYWIQEEDLLGFTMAHL
ncbi:hypothetical protein C2845_PM18G05170 [Panicum miliaceum]|uniref:Uncharacterized protein n=1 Tax=Panicum miliaceum TaxID=4540 RepID=A0A3L6PI77_PANMI|nr:hypothetical protein C2845_PM18G05170 [Panicum miliaceum]